MEALTALERIARLEAELQELRDQVGRQALGVETPQPSRTTTPLLVDISEGELLDLYDRCPGILSAYAVAVETARPEGLVQNVRGTIRFRQQQRGWFWVLTFQGQTDQALLLPDPNRLEEIVRRESYIGAFFLDGDQEPGRSRPALIRPATLIRLEAGKRWQLDQPGVLDWGGKPTREKIQAKLTRLTLQMDSLAQRIAELEGQSIIN